MFSDSSLYLWLCPRYARAIILAMFFRRVRGCHHPILTGLSTKYLLGISSRTTIRCIADKYCKNYLNDQMWNQEDFNYRLRERTDGDLHRSVLCVARVFEDEFDRCMCLRSVLCWRMFLSLTKGRSRINEQSLHLIFTCECFDQFPDPLKKRTSQCPICWDIWFHRMQ